MRRQARAPQESLKVHRVPSAPRTCVCRQCTDVSRYMFAASVGHMKRHMNISTARVCWNSWWRTQAMAASKRRGAHGSESSSPCRTYHRGVAGHRGSSQDAQGSRKGGHQRVQPQSETGWKTRQRCDISQKAVSSSGCASGLVVELSQLHTESISVVITDESAAARFSSSSLP